MNAKFLAFAATSFATKPTDNAPTNPAKINHDDDMQDDDTQDDGLDYVLNNLDAIDDSELLTAVLRSA